MQCECLNRQQQLQQQQKQQKHRKEAEEEGVFWNHRKWKGKSIFHGLCVCVLIWVGRWLCVRWSFAELIVACFKRHYHHCFPFSISFVPNHYRIHLILFSVLLLNCSCFALNLSVLSFSVWVEFFVRLCSVFFSYSLR